jgi:phospholipase C
MRLISLLSVSLLAPLAFAQQGTPNTPFQHVIIVIQENRTPDNLFGSDAFARHPELPGADLVKKGLCRRDKVLLQSIALGDVCDPNHGHADAWVPTFNDGRMDGACTLSKKGINCSMKDPEYTFVNGADVVPYFEIAKQYGYANYMFQTNQGPSFPAHQFLFSGTSAPARDDGKGDSHKFWEWFAAENTRGVFEPYGCTAKRSQVWVIAPNGRENLDYRNGMPCYEHDSMATLLDANNITWKYYAHSEAMEPSNPATGLWTAPNAIASICQVNKRGNQCEGPQWRKNVASVFPNSPKYRQSYSPILTDLGADPHEPRCTLPGVSWVIPDGAWSDHAGLSTDDGGPSWVSAIINAVGGYDNEGRKLSTHCKYWENTVILVTWDDWGGWYDHVSPSTGKGGPGIGYPNGTGSHYVYGFRVPLLVVSAYSHRGYISGALPPYGPGEVRPYIHDFGSILNFIEYAFGVNQQSIAPFGGIYPTYPYADWYAPDGNASDPQSPYSLSDFFDNFSNPHKFEPLTRGIRYSTRCFLTPRLRGCFGSNFQPSDPDGDNIHEQD